MNKWIKENALTAVIATFGGLATIFTLVFYAGGLVQTINQTQSDVKDLKTDVGQIKTDVAKLTGSDHVAAK